MHRLVQFFLAYVKYYFYVCDDGKPSIFNPKKLSDSDCRRIRDIEDDRATEQTSAVTIGCCTSRD
jgi:hypothetical protein